MKTRTLSIALLAALALSALGAYLYLDRQRIRAHDLQRAAFSWAEACLAENAPMDITAAVSASEIQVAVAYLEKSGPEPRLSCKQKGRIFMTLLNESRKSLPSISGIPDQRLSPAVESAPKP